MKCTLPGNAVTREDIRVKELKSLESVGADRGFIPPSVRYRNILNFGTGLILGCISVPMWNYSKFLYYSVFCVQAIILFILINSKEEKIWQCRKEGGGSMWCLRKYKGVKE